MPKSYTASSDSSNSGQLKFRDFFPDKNLIALVDTALKNNIDVLMTLQEIEIAKNEARIRKSYLLPTVNGRVETSLEKVGLYTSQGAGDASAEITPGEKVPENLADYNLGLQTTWEADIWGKLRNSKKAAVLKYLSTVEGKNFVLTNLVAEIANSYYELLSYDNQLDIIRQTIQLQKDAFEIIKIQKEAAQVTELAVKQFEAELLNSQSMEFDVLQKISETENKINFLAGRFPQRVQRDKESFMSQELLQVKAGIPPQLLSNRTDIKQAEYELLAAKCDVKAAKAEFYPSLGISAGLGFQGFKPSYLFTTPQSLAYTILGELTAPLINRSAIKAEFNKAKAVQLSAMYNYQRSILNGYVEVANELSNLYNLEKSYNLKAKKVEVLNNSIDISSDLFKSARANYLEVLLTQREALDSKIELVETKKEQLVSVTNLYKALGGGWK